MTSPAVIGGKGLMPDRIEQALLRPAMGVMTGDTGISPRLNPLMGGSE